MSQYDELHRFLLNAANVRGELVRVEESLRQIVHSTEYPVQIQRLLCEMTAATCLLTAILKFKGEIALQIQSKGPVSYAVINATHDYSLRGVARWNENLPVLPETFAELVDNAVLVITITPDEGERYQGVIALDKPSLAECLEDYFSQSEQLSTQIILMTDMREPARARAAGMLMQVLPSQAANTDVAADTEFEHVCKLTETLTEEEMFGLPVNDILYRLYHQEEVEVYPAHPISFGCSCSKQRSADALRNIDKQELLTIIEEDGAIKMNCQYCHAEYVFDSVDVEAIHSGQFVETRKDQ